MAKVNVSIPDELLDRLDEYADENFMSRSGAITMMVNQYLTSRELQIQIKSMTASLQKLASNIDLTEEEKMQLLGFEQLAKALPGM